MIGPTGVGKTEIARRLARLAQAPFLKVEATKFTEVGYVGRDVDQIVRDLVEIALAMVRERRRAGRAAPRPRRPPRSGCSTRWSAPGAGAGHARDVPQEAARRRARRQGGRADAGRHRLADAGLRHSRHAGRQMGVLNLAEMLGKAFGGRTKPRKHHRRATPARR